jgi:stress response protein YsnF
VEQGGVRVTTRVEEVPVNEQVTVREEHVSVDRRAVDRAVTDADLAAVQQGAFEVREHREEVVVDKQARIVEEVVINKDVDTHTETIQDTVRSTDVNVQEITGETRTSDYVETGRTRAGDVTGTGTTYTTRSGNVAGTGQDEGAIERGLSSAGNAAERATGRDLDRDGDVGRRDPRNNV